MKTDLNGNWKGVISLGEEYGEYFGEEITYRTKLKHEGNKITGVSHDISGIGSSSDPADIIGELNGLQINFTKKYRTFHALDYKGRVTVDRKTIGPKIDYYGIFDEADEQFKGAWSMSTFRKFLWLFPIENKVTGTWTMKRE